MTDKQLTHIGENNKPRMVDVSDKTVTKRIAKAQAIVALPEPVLSALSDGELMTKKGPVFQTAIIAGTQAVKRTSELIPFCHSLPIDGIDFEISMKGDRLQVVCSVSVTAKTGVEMEALTGVSVAALTIYDMCKALSQDIVILETRLISKKGGKSDFQKIS